MKNKTICITRPLPQGKNLASAIEVLGAQCVLLPTLEIEIFPDHIVQKAFEQNVAGNVLDKIIFTSSHAVASVTPYLNTSYKDSCLFAVGPATADTLRHFNLNPLLPKTYNSEGLLALPELQAVQDQNIVIFSGEGGKDLLWEVLIKRGARVKKIAIYRRLCPILPPDFSPRPFSLIISTSLESLQNLWQMVGEPHPDYLREQRLLVISPAMIELAEQLGFIQKPVLADNAADGAILESVRQVLLDMR